MDTKFIGYIIALAATTIDAQPTIFEEIHARIQSNNQQIEKIYQNAESTAIINKRAELNTQLQTLHAHTHVPTLKQKHIEQEKETQKIATKLYEKNKKEFVQISTQIQELQNTILPLRKQQLALENKIATLAQDYVSKIKEIGNSIIEKSGPELSALRNSQSAHANINRAIYQEEAKLYPRIQNVQRQINALNNTLDKQSLVLSEPPQNDYWQQKQTVERMNIMKELIENPAHILQIDYRKFIGK